MLTAEMKANIQDLATLVSQWWWVTVNGVPGGRSTLHFLTTSVCCMTIMLHSITPPARTLSSVRQFSRLKPQQTTDLLALGTNASKHRGGFIVACNIRFGLPPCSGPLTFQNKQIPSSGWKARLVKLGCDRPAEGAFNEWNTLYMYPKGKSPSSTNWANFADI